MDNYHGRIINHTVRDGKTLFSKRCAKVHLHYALKHAIEKGYRIPRMFSFDVYLSILPHLSDDENENENRKSLKPFTWMNDIVFSAKTKKTKKPRI